MCNLDSVCPWEEVNPGASYVAISYWNPLQRVLVSQGSPPQPLNQNQQRSLDLSYHGGIGHLSNNKTAAVVEGSKDRQHQDLLAPTRLERKFRKKRPAGKERQGSNNRKYAKQVGGQFSCFFTNGGNLNH